MKRLVGNEPRVAEPLCPSHGLQRPQSVRGVERRQKQVGHDERGRGLCPVVGGVGAEPRDRVATLPVAPAGAYIYEL